MITLSWTEWAWKSLAHQLQLLPIINWKCRCVLGRRITVYHGNRVTLSKLDIWLLLSRQHRRKCYLFEVRKALTSATGTPSGGRQCNTIMPFRGTSVPWGSSSKFFLRSKGENKQPALKNNYNSMKEHPPPPKKAICFMCDLLLSHIQYVQEHGVGGWCLLQDDTNSLKKNNLFTGK